MASRPRSIARRNWPRGLRERDGYFSWVAPDGVEHGIGRISKGDAFAQAIEANLHVADLLTRPRLLDRLTGKADRTFNAWLDLYEKILRKRKIAPATLKNGLYHVKHTRALGAHLIERITTLMVGDFLKPWTENDKLRMAQSLRSFLHDCFREAMAAGWVDKNPVDVLTVEAPRVKRARLTLETFNTIYQKALTLDAWIPRCLELALVSAQRREDLNVILFKQPKAIEGANVAWVDESFLSVSQGKEDMRLRIPLSLRLAAVDWKLADIVERCRDGYTSDFLIHHTTRARQARPGAQVWIDTLSKGFTRARNLTDLEWPGKAPPTLHEVRSLAIRLYTKERGKEFAQALAGHKDPKTTALYRDVRGAEWIEILDE